MVFAMVGAGARLRGAAGSWMIGPHELASVIGKLELLARAGSDDRARLGSELELLDLQSQELLRLRLVMVVRLKLNQSSMLFLLLLVSRK